MACQFDCIERPLRQFFASYGRLVARQPIPFLIIPVLITAGLASGFFFFEKISDPEELFTNEGSKVRQANQFMEDHFPPDASLKNWLRVTVTCKDESKDNIWSRDTMKDIIALNYIITMEKFTDKTSGKNLTFDDVCVRDPSNGRCITGPILNLLHYDPERMGDAKIYYPYHEFPVIDEEPIKLPVAWSLGGVELSETGYVMRAKSMWLTYLTDQANNDSITWENIVRDKLVGEEIYNSSGKYPSIKLTVLSTTSMESELEKLAERALPLFSITIVILLAFAVIVCLSLDWVIAKPWLALSGILSAVMAIGSGFGLLLHFFPFLDILAVVPFLGLGIGLDDMFVMLSSWRRTSNKLGVEERMGEAFSDAAVSITITTLTDILAIGIGAISDVQSVRSFCIFATVVIFLDYVYQITFFAACLVLTGRREARRSHALTCMEATPKIEALHRSCCFKFWCTGGTSTYLKTPAEHQGFTIMVWFRDSYGSFITALPTKIFVALVYVLYFTFAVYGCLLVKQGLVLERVVADDSYVAQDLVTWQTNHIEYDQPVYIVIKSPLKYWEKADRARVDSLASLFENNPHIHNRNISDIWTRDFDAYLHRKNITVTKDNYIMVLSQLILDDSNFKRFAKHIVFNDNRTDIVTSRLLLYPTDLTTPESKMQLLKDMWAIEDSSNLGIEITSPLFLHYEAWINVLPTLLQNFGIATASVLIVCLLLIPNPLCSIYVALSIVSICLGLVGYMTLWDIHIDSVSMINVIMAIGFSVDFTAHLTYAFSIAPGDSRDSRVKEALHGLGVPIVQASLSTIFGILVLCDSPAYIFRVFFVTIFLTMAFGAIHGLVFIPVVLSIIGPPAVQKESAKDEIISGNLTQSFGPLTSTQKFQKEPPHADVGNNWPRSFMFHPSNPHLKFPGASNGSREYLSDRPALEGNKSTDMNFHPYHQKKIWTIDRYSIHGSSINTGREPNGNITSATNKSFQDISSIPNNHTSNRKHSSLLGLSTNPIAKKAKRKLRRTSLQNTESKDLQPVHQSGGAFGYQRPFWSNQFNNAYELNSTISDSSGIYSYDGFEEADTTFQWMAH